MKNKILVIAGPTAVGKTSLSLSLAKELSAEIVSADSMQIYKGLDIGTAKATPTERKEVKHHMIDFLDPSEKFSVAQYVSIAGKVVDDIFSRGLVPLVTGGTGLYIDNLIYENDFGEMTIDPKLREKLNLRAKNEGGETLLHELSLVDPEYAEKLHKNDVKRIVHALEIYHSTGNTQTDIIRKSRTRTPKYDFLYVVLDYSSREKLYLRINERVDVMISNGLIEEARAVVSAPWYVSSTASQAIGYKEFIPYFQKDASLEECVDLLKQRSRNYAKRQLTWFRNKKEARFIYLDECTDPLSEILNLYNA